MDNLRVAYSTLKSVTSSGSIKVYWAKNADGSYRTWFTTDQFFCTCNVVSANDIADFALSGSAAYEVGSEDDARILSYFSSGGVAIDPRSSDGRPVYLISENAAAEGILSGSLADTVTAYMGTSAASNQAIRATAYTEQTGSGVFRSLKSSVGTDVSGSTGAWQVQIKYYDDSMNGPFYETVNLNGTGSVNTVNTNIRFVDWMKSVLVGSNGINDGTITLFNGANGVGSAIGTIAAGDGQTFWSHHYVRSGRVAYMRQYAYGTVTNPGVAANGMKVFARRSQPLTPNSYTEIKGTWIRVVPASSTQQGSYEVPFQFPGPCRMELVARPDTTGSATVFTAYGYYEV